MGNPVFVINDRVSMVDMFNFKCSNCGHTFDMTEVNLKCPECDKELFERMRKSTFTKLFVEALSAIGVATNKAIKFANSGEVKVSELGICTEMSIAVDLNFQLKFGGQYKSFFIKDTFDTIKENNFGRFKDE